MTGDLLHRMDKLQVWDSVPREEKLAWGEGPWVDEPDKVQWLDTVTDLDCLAKRNHMGGWCGYVGLPPGHRLYGKPYQEAEQLGEGQWLEVHGGLTYASLCQELPEGVGPEHGVCHVPLPGRPADVWWLGFDCGHAMDLQPAFEYRMQDLAKRAKVDLPEAPPIPGFMDTYRDLPYVQAEVIHLAEQLV